MVTFDDLKPGGYLPAPMVVEVSDVEWYPEISRRAIVEVVDSAGNALRLVDFEGANVSIDWTPGRRYRIANCGVGPGGGGYELELTPGERTQILDLEPGARTFRLLVLGDSHVGRREHPKTGREIDPLGAFISAARYGIDNEVDAVVHTGDIFHEPATPLDVKFVRDEVLQPLKNCRTPFYYVRGNHSSPIGTRLLDRQSSQHVCNLDLEGRALGPEIKLYGIDHVHDGAFDWSEIRFPRNMDETIAVLVLHQTIEQLSGADASGAVDLRRIQERAPRDFDLIVSGHHHDAITDLWNGIPVMYTGSTERMSKTKDPQDRIAWLVTVEDGTVAHEAYQIPDDD